MHATYFGANGWLLELGGLRVLVDPWLTGPLQFPPGPWFFQGELPTSRPVPPDLDLLLLSQGLDDHCHPPTLALLPKHCRLWPRPRRRPRRAAWASSR